MFADKCGSLTLHRYPLLGVSTVQGNPWESSDKKDMFSSHTWISLINPLASKSFWLVLLSTRKVVCQASQTSGAVEFRLSCGKFKRTTQGLVQFALRSSVVGQWTWYVYKYKYIHIYIHNIYIYPPLGHSRGFEKTVGLYFKARLTETTVCLLSVRIIFEARQLVWFIYLGHS